MLHPAYKAPLRFVLRLRLQKEGVYLRDTTVIDKKLQTEHASKVGTEKNYSGR